MVRFGMYVSNELVDLRHLDEIDLGLVEKIALHMDVIGGVCYYVVLDVPTIHKRL
jgi:hypothetical protein